LFDAFLHDMCFKHMSAFGRTILKPVWQVMIPCKVGHFSDEHSKNLQSESLSNSVLLKRTHLVCRNAVGLSIYML
jgi:hypothetical protein